MGGERTPIGGVHNIEDAGTLEVPQLRTTWHEPFDKKVCNPKIWCVVSALTGGVSCNFLTASPPAEKATARQD
jgi:hypothetical protein